MFAVGLEAFQFGLPVEYPKTVERLVETYDEPVSEVFGYTSAVARGVSYDGAVVGHHLDMRPAVECVDHHARFVRLGECESQHGCAVRGCDFCHDIVIGQIYAVIVGPCLLRLVREPASARGFVDRITASHGHQRELSVVVYPRRGLVGLLESADRVRAVGVCPAVAHLARLGRPEVHAPRQGHGRIGVARRKRVVGLRAHERRDIFRGAELRLLGRFVGAGGQREKRESEYLFHSLHLSYGSESRAGRSLPGAEARSLRVRNLRRLRPPII